MNFLKAFFRMYAEGIKNMSSQSKKLWLLIFIKLFIMFAILKIFFFNNYLNSKFDNDQEKGDYIIERLTK